MCSLFFIQWDTSLPSFLPFLLSPTTPNFFPSFLRKPSRQADVVGEPPLHDYEFEFTYCIYQPFYTLTEPLGLEAFYTWRNEVLLTAPLLVLGLRL